MTSFITTLLQHAVGIAKTNILRLDAYLLDSTSTAPSSVHQGKCTKAATQDKSSSPDHIPTDAIVLTKPVAVALGERSYSLAEPLEIVRDHPGVILATTVPYQPSTSTSPLTTYQFEDTEISSLVFPCLTEMHACILGIECSSMPPAGDHLCAVNKLQDQPQLSLFDHISSFNSTSTSQHSIVERGTEDRLYDSGDFSNDQASCSTCNSSVETRHH